MNAFEGILDDLNKTDFDFLENSWKGIEDFNKVKFGKMACVKLWSLSYS
jgi:hypothetical protein